jgi:hypothetical protein
MKNLFFLLFPLLFACQPESQTVTLSGRCYFAPDATKPIAGAVVEALGEQSYQTGTKPDGTWEIEVQPGEYIVRPFKRTDTLNGIDLADRALIQQHLIGVAPLNQWQKFAADVNESLTATTFDAYLVGAAIYNIPEARQIIGGWWTFCPSDYVAPATDGFYVPQYPISKEVDAQSDVNGIDFVAFRRGDANMNADPTK